MLVFYYFGAFFIILDHLIEIIEMRFLTITSINAIILHYFSIIYELFVIIFILILYCNVCFAFIFAYFIHLCRFNPTCIAVMPDDESFTPHHDDEPAGARTPPTPAVEDSPPPSPRPLRQRSMARRRPVSIPGMVRDLAGKDAIRAIGDFVSHCMPDGR